MKTIYVRNIILFITYCFVDNTFVVLQKIVTTKTVSKPGQFYFISVYIYFRGMYL